MMTYMYTVAVHTVERLEDKNENIRKENTELHNKYIDVSVFFIKTLLLKTFRFDNNICYCKSNRKSKNSLVKSKH